VGGGKDVGRPTERLVANLRRSNKKKEGGVEFKSSACKREDGVELMLTPGRGMDRQKSGKGAGNKGRIDCKGEGIRRHD